MASWLKAACLPKVVDRRGKSVVEDLSEEQSDLHLPASNKKGSQAKRLKVQRESKVVKEESSNNRHFFGDQSRPGVSQSEVPTSRDSTD
ncbi:unnamed protein product [Brassica rapa]|uniref:Uncharacterized protein n=1 Tax=Brassica campestris TaxID=3711 RepID=A0A3P6AZB7_BRACM|nr:unnamed protein product [Brassica rapa]VDC95155.1 unnamed protein product [Brassica rapa]